MASLCIVHGWGEHSSLYLDLAFYFAQQGFVVHMLDLRGFGYSGGSRFQATVQDMHKVTPKILSFYFHLIGYFLVNQTMQ
jgi:alpha-beta hydrolase superfamily lysophospholipase